jgi:ABC-type multidrug transport system ATPase subunit/pSer/pThr/pTyr-binding forkhead associated (FHA) protein
MVSNEQTSREVAFLLGEIGSFKDQRIFLDKPRVVFGRDKQSCDFVLSPAFISKTHAVFETDSSGRTTIRDLDSRLGTFVNGKPVAEQELADGDMVGFGPGGVIAFRFCARKAATPDKGTELRSQLLAYAGTAVKKTPQVAAPAVAVPRESPALTEKPVMRLGRAPDNDIVLNSGAVSRYHATLTFQGNQPPVLADLRSTNGTFVNGELLREPRALRPGDLVYLGGFLLRVDGRTVHTFDLSSSRITAEGITQELGGRVILQDVTLVLYPREFVGLMGPSGCGKSTLMDAMNGLRPAKRGSVFLNNLDLYRHFNALRRSIGYVPQRDNLHEALTVERTLYFAAKLRLPEETPLSELFRIVDEVIETVGLTQQRQTQFRQLSGGQQKRLSLAIELITKPSFLFLDEPTSPLDPETTENMMLLFRKLADQGRIVVMVTHKFEKFFEMHQVAILARGGHLAFFGPPQAALEYFRCSEPAEIYRRISPTEPEELSRRFRSSPHYDQYVRHRIAESHTFTGESEKVGALPAAAPAKPERRISPAQWWTLTRRFLEIKLKDRRNTALLLLQAPIIAMLLVVITGDQVNDAKALFIAAIIAIWFGANNAIREIVAEAEVYVRERRYSLKIPSYVLSKFAVLSGIGLIQCLSFLALLIGFGRLRGDDFLALFVVLYLTTLGGICTGLFFSALVSSTEKAMSVLPLILIPQLLLSGFLKPVDDIYVNARTGKPASVEDYQRFEDARTNIGQQPDPRARLRMAVAPPDPIRKSDGLGAANPISALMMARWATEGLVHVVSIRDHEARDRLAAQLWVYSYARVFAGDSPERIESSYRQRVRTDMAILGGFILLFLALTMLALGRKDVL